MIEREGGAAVAQFWWSTWVGSVAPYAVLLRLFVDGRMTAAEFELVFLRLYKVDSTPWPSELFGVLDGLFGDVDAYCVDDEVRREVGGLDADELRHRAANTLRQLEVLAPGVTNEVMTMASSAGDRRPREFIGFVWFDGDWLGKREGVLVVAGGVEEAGRIVRECLGPDVGVSVWNEDDAMRPR